MTDMQRQGFAVRDLTVRYVDGNAGMTALDHVSADFPAGGVTAIIGESGDARPGTLRCAARRSGDHGTGGV